MNSYMFQFAAEEADKASGIAALGIEPRAFLIQFITFVLVFFVLKKYVFSRVVDTLEKRRKTIEEGLRLTTEMSAEKQKLEKEIAQAHKTARKQSDEIVASSRAQADAIVSEAEEKAAAKAENMLVEAKKKIDEETQRAKRGLEKDMVDLVIQATEFVAHEKIDAKKDKQLIAEALKGQS